MVFIYILKLENGKYYVGKSLNPIKRLENHFNENGSDWTKENKPIEVLNVFEGDNFDEDKYVKKYMSEFGIDNVRGGSYSKMNISFQDRKVIENEIRGSTDKCFKCGSSSHFVRDCDAKKDVSGKYLNVKQRKVRRPCVSCGGDHKIIECPNPGNICYRCGKSDHWRIRCTSDYDINGYELKYDIISTIGSMLYNLI
jgi:hypothetical protein